MMELRRRDNPESPSENQSRCNIQGGYQQAAIFDVVRRYSAEDAGTCSVAAQEKNAG